MSNRTESMSSLLQTAILNSLKNLHTCLPAFVEDFDPVTQTVKVQPAISRILSGDRIVPLPILINVPVVQMSANGFSITLPIKKGDECLVVFCERSIDKWFESGELNPPNDIRFHDINDGFAIMGINSKPNVITEYDPENLVLRNEDASVAITIKPTDEIELKTPTKITVDTPDANFTGNITAQGDIRASGEVADGNGELSRLRDNYNQHKHTGNQGAPTSGTDSPDT